MALFSRRPKSHDPVTAEPEAEPAGPVADAASDAVAEPAASPETTPETTPESTPEVPISVTTYGAPAAPPRPAASGAARAVPGFEDNALLVQALARLDPKPTPAQTLDVARQLLQGRVYLRVRGQVQELLAAGEELPMATATIGEDRYAIAFSGGAALQAAVRADGDSATSAVAIGVPALLRQVIDGPFAGLLIDPASSPAAVVLPRALVEKMLEDLDDSLAVKSALTGERTDVGIAALVVALQTAPLWIAAKRDDDGRVGISQTRLTDGTRMLEVFSHPLEVHVLGRGDQSVKVTAAQIGAALAGEADLAGVVVNPQGPWMRLTREELAPLIALAQA